MDDIPVKQPPHSIEAEQSVLGGLMLNNNAWLDLAGRLSEDDFYREDHRLIFRGIRELLDVGKPCDFVTLSEYLRGRGSLDPAGGLSYLGSLANDTPSAANVLAYADIVRERAVLRSLIKVGQEIADLGFRPGEQSYADLMETAEQRVFAIREQGERGRQEFQHVGEALDKVEARLEILRERPDELAGVPTGLHDLDRKIHGLSKGDLLILAGRPGMGKTSFAMNIAEHIAIHEKKPVGVFSMEMGADQLAMRILASYCRMDQSALRSGQIEDHQWDWLAQASRDIREAPLFIDETPALSPLELRARARRMKRRHGLSLIVVDYIQLMQVPGTRENRTNEISQISRNLKALAKEMEVPVIALSQLSREVEKRENKRPVLSDLRESGSIEQDADLVVFIYRDAYYRRKEGDPAAEQDNRTEIIIAKHRNGPTGTVHVAFLGGSTRFENLTYRDDAH
ncbi:replicative DNA helicase [Algiphilus sp.]|uniref:replicative DNA helicase n=1 Tax=Algiphilus sp. TaxID=1872431 RepID=UPI003B52F400